MNNKKLIKLVKKNEVFENKYNYCQLYNITFMQWPRNGNGTCNENQSERYGTYMQRLWRGIETYCENEPLRITKY